MNLEGPVPGTPLCRDPHARALVESLMPASELDLLIDAARMDRDELAVIEGVRSTFMDRFVMDCLGKRIRQVVLIGSGMDCRAFRLDLPPQMTIIEVDELAVHESKSEVMNSTGARARCRVRHQTFSWSSGASSEELIGAIAPAFNAQKPALFLLDGALGTWPANARLAALSAAATLAVEGSMIVGPAPEEDVTPVLHQAGFGKTNIINHLQLQKIYRRPMPQTVKMLVAMHGSAPSAGDGANAGSPGGSSTRAKEIHF